MLHLPALNCIKVVPLPAPPDPGREACCCGNNDCMGGLGMLRKGAEIKIKGRMRVFSAYLSLSPFLFSFL